MTNQSSDIQPALRPFNVLVRGGRLTKFKGRVASIAPGLSVVATAAVLLTGGAAQAADECGTDNDNDGVISCDADADPNTPGNQSYADGITYNTSDDLTLELDNPNITVNGSGVQVNGTDTANITVHMKDGTVTSDSHGVSAFTETGSGSVHAQLDGDGEITINGDSSSSVGLRARISYKESTETATATMTGGKITVAAGAEGVAAFTHGRSGDVTAQMSGGLVTTEQASGANAAVYAGSHETGYVGTVTAEMSGADSVIHTKNNGGLGLRATTRSTSADSFAIAHMKGGKITTEGANAYAVVAAYGGGMTAERARLTESNFVARMTGGTIETFSNATAIKADNTGVGNALVEMDETDGRSTIITYGGSQAHGMRAYSASSGEADGTARAVMRAGTITVHADSSYGAAAHVAGGLGTATTEMHGGSITMYGAGTAGLYAKTGSRKTATVEMTGGTVLTTNSSGNYWGSHGIYVTTGSDGDAAIVNMEGGTVTATGRNSHAILAEVTSAADTLAEAEVKAKAIVNVGEDAVVTASGAASDGIRILGEWVDPGNASNRVLLRVKEFEVSVAGSVTGGARGVNSPDIHGAAIRTISHAEGSGTIHIANTATVRAGSNGLAIADWDGDAVVTVDGTVTGDIRLGGGDDTLTISSGASYDFSHTLDGGLGDNDQLTLHGQTVDSMENIRNWEHLALNGSQVSLDGVAMLEAGLFVDAGSVVHATGANGAAIADGAARASGGGMTITGDVTNAGAVTLSVQDGVTGDEITIEGDYTQTGSGVSVFALDTALRGEGSNSDRVVIAGDTSGEMRLSLAGLDSITPEVAPLELEVVSVGGTSDGTFTLVDGNYVMSDGEHGVIAGAHLYTLAKTDGGWALSALLESGEVNYQPSAPVYDSYGPSLLALNAVSSLRNRGSSEDFRSLAWGGQGAQNTGSPFWIQMGTDQITSSAEHSTTGAALDSSLWEMEIGADIVLSDSSAGLLVSGLMLSYATGSTDVSSDFGDGSIDTTGLGLGLSATWYDTRRFYVDGQFTFASYSSDLNSDRLGALTEGNGGTGYALSLEAGQRLDLGSRLAVIPQAQLSLSAVEFSDFTGVEDYAERVAFEEASSQQLRLGLEFGAQDPGASGLYGIVNLFHEFGAGSEVDLSERSLTTESEPWAVGVGLGGRYAWSDRVDLFGEASYATGLSNAGDTSALSANAGLKVVF